MPTPEETVETNLSQPKRAKIGQQEAEQHGLTEQIAAAEFIANKDASNKATLPIRFAQLKPGSTV